MATITRSFSIPVLTFGFVPTEAAEVFHEVGMRVDAGAKLAQAKPELITATLDSLKAQVEPFLKKTWAHRFLCGYKDARALAYARVHADKLPRSYVLLPCPFEAEGLATYLLRRLAFEPLAPGGVRVHSVQVSLDPGSSYRAEVSNTSTREVSGGAVCSELGPNHPIAYARMVVNYPTPKPPSRADSGATS